MKMRRGTGSWVSGGYHLKIERRHGNGGTSCASHVRDDDSFMATLIPSLGSARFDSRGELRLAERLKDFLEDNSYIWHNLPMGRVAGTQTSSSSTLRKVCW